MKIDNIGRNVLPCCLCEANVNVITGLTKFHIHSNIRYTRAHNLTFIEILSLHRLYNGWSIFIWTAVS